VVNIKVSDFSILVSWDQKHIYCGYIKLIEHPEALKMP